MSDPAYTNQYAFNVGDDDNTDPDSVTFDGCNTKRTGVAANDKFHIRFGIENTGGKDTSSVSWRVHYNTTNSFSTATQITTSTDNDFVMAGGQPDNNANTDTTVCTGTGSRVNGRYFEDPSTECVAFKVGDGQFVELQAC
ncbi:MAG: hypothetical protein GWN00_27485, partial [Aliifodinibius sp.]|nr:hypothetical protein [Phycisphaerae bacterium]NIT59827.1 hypothetical protein [Fodinibius sp.]NIU27197.1 hypothetical protein [candidate division KSB1 bacterium]NIV69142.1 hypothetical protein [Phycisphaerae bacterium]NIW21087.1 hypothetical protein [candidate division KSB1 bacterium]